MKHIITFIFMMITASSVHAGQVNIPHAFSAGNPAVANEVNSNFAAGAAQINDNHSRIAQLEQANAALQATVNSLLSQVAANDARMTQLETTSAAQQTTISTIQSNSVLALDGNLQYIMDANGYPTAQFTGVNVQVINGIDQGTPNGTGNLIVGYNQPDLFNGLVFCSDGNYTDKTRCENAGELWSRDQKTGSHNIVVGNHNNYTQTGGIVAGFRNAINNTYAAVLGGRQNHAQGAYSVVSAGRMNSALGDDSSVSAGTGNSATGPSSTVSGGQGNNAAGSFSSVSGGARNTASGSSSAVSGGAQNRASGSNSTVSGGESNSASGSNSTVSGGSGRTVTGDRDWAGGGLFEER